MSHRLRPVDASFLDDAPLVIRASVDLDATPGQVWVVLGSDQMWSWMPLISDLRWVTPRPHGVGTTRTLRLAGLVTLEEEFFRWEEQRRATFHVTRASRKLFSALAEDFLLEEIGSDGRPRTRLTWTMAIEPRVGASLPLGVLAPLLAPGNKLGISGIRRLLPAG